MFKKLLGTVLLIVGVGALCMFGFGAFTGVSSFGFTRGVSALFAILGLAVACGGAALTVF